MCNPWTDFVPCEVFAADAYDRFYESALPDERSDRDASLIRRLGRVVVVIWYWTSRAVMGG
jgi:hypothetical protein